MSDTQLRIVQSVDEFQIRCPMCSRVLYSGTWHVVLVQGEEKFFVGDVLQCCVRVRCQAVFQTRSGAVARYQTVNGIAQFLGTDSLELMTFKNLEYAPRKHVH